METTVRGSQVLVIEIINTDHRVSRTIAPRNGNRCEQAEGWLGMPDGGRCGLALRPLELSVSVLLPVFLGGQGLGPSWVSGLQATATATAVPLQQFRLSKVVRGHPHPQSSILIPHPDHRSPITWAHHSSKPALRRCARGVGPL